MLVEIRKRNGEDDESLGPGLVPVREPKLDCG
jgi:hypothetical protein